MCWRPVASTVSFPRQRVSRSRLPRPHHGRTGVTPRGVHTAESDYEVATIVHVTGFDAITGALLGMGSTEGLAT